MLAKIRIQKDTETLGIGAVRKVAGEKQPYV